MPFIIAPNFRVYYYVHTTQGTKSLLLPNAGSSRHGHGNPMPPEITKAVEKLYLLLN